MATYYVKTGGSNAAAGTSDAAAWASFAKVNSFAFAPGDVVMFRAGDTFTGVLYSSSHNGVVFTSYDPITFLPSALGAYAILKSVTPDTVFGAPTGVNNVSLLNLEFTTTEPPVGAGQHTLIANDAGAVCLNWIIKSCSIHGAGGGGIIVNNLSTTGWTIDGNEIYNLGDNGVLLNLCGGGHVIKNNKIHDVGLYDGSHGRHGIYAHAHDYQIYGNEFWNCPNGQAISLRNNGDGSSGKAFLNTIHDTPNGIGFFSTAGDTSTGLLMAFANVLYNIDVYGIYGGDNPLYCDTLIANNTIVMTYNVTTQGQSVGIDLEDMLHANSIVLNNIVVGGRDAFYMNNAPLDPGKTITEDYNVFFGQSQPTPYRVGAVNRNRADYVAISGQSAHSFTTDPLLDPNHKPRYGSAAINTGTTAVRGLTFTNGGTGVWTAAGLDYSGPGPDRGAIEYVASAPSTQLGCGTYEAYVLTRGGGTLVAVIPWNSLTWDRVLDDTSQGSVTADGECSQLGAVRPWQHEIAIYRDGVLVWVGPVLNPSAPVSGDQQSVQVLARDLTVWWDHRRIHNDHDYTANPTDLAQIFQDFATDAMSVDNSPGLVVSTTPCGVLGVRTILGTQHQIAGLELRDLAKTGIDWTTVGRTVLAGGSSVPTASIGTFTDEHFTQPPKPNLDGTAQANDWVVRGAGGGVAGDVIYGEHADPSAQARDGVLEAVDTVSTIQDNASAEAAATTRVALTSAVLSVEEAYLAASAPFPIATLVPGALCQLALTQTIIPVSGQYRLQSVSVAARGSDGVEQVVLTFQPVGTM